MARRRGRRRGGGGTAAPARHPVGLPRLDANSLSCVADFCSLRDCCALRHRISKRTSQQLASADESEVFARARVLQRVAAWWKVTLWSDVPEYVPVPEQSEGNPLGCLTRKGNLNHIRHQLRVLLRARHVRTMRLGGLQAFCQYAVIAMTRMIYNAGGEAADLERELMEFPVRPGSLESLNTLEDTRKYVLRLMDEAEVFNRPALKQFYLLFFHCQRFSEFLALDKALRRGTQRPHDCLVGPWRFLEQSLSRDYCPCCDRFRNQRRPEFHFRTTRRGDDKCPSCDMIGWADALKRYRLTREQLPRGSVTWHRKATRSGFFRVPMVPRSRAEAVARQVWGDDWKGRIARAKTRAQKKKRRRQRDAVAKRKSYNEVRGTRVFVTTRGFMPAEDHWNLRVCTVPSASAWNDELSGRHSLVFIDYCQDPLSSQSPRPRTC